jgi:predicted RNA-binding protein with RPS1 domain
MEKINSKDVLQKLRPESKFPKETASKLYKIGDEVECFVTAVHPTVGAFINTLDGASGLIHKSNVIKDSIIRPEEYFYVEQPIKGIIEAFDDKGNAKITVFHLELSPLQMSITAESSDSLESLLKKSEQEKIKLLQEMNKIKREMETFQEKEINVILDKIHSIVPDVSESTKEFVAQLVKEHGISEVSLTLPRTIASFDPSYALAKDLERNLKRGYL